MSLKPHSYQLSFALDISEDEADVSKGLSAVEIQTRKDLAQGAIENGEVFKKNEHGEPEYPFWFENYLNYKEGHYPFRVAIYMAWLGTPKSKRFPKTKKELADMLGLSSPRQFNVWESKNPKIRSEANMAWKNRVLDGLNDTVDAMLEVASTPNYKGKYDRELHVRLARELTDLIQVSDAHVDLSKLSYEEKLGLAGLNKPGALKKFREEQVAKLDEENSESDE